MSTHPLIYPPRIAPGDIIGIAAPASPPEKPEIIDEALQRFTALGFNVRSGRYLRERDGYLAGSDEERASDINAFFADPDVKGIFTLRGGYGSCRILPLLDYAAIRANPKPLVGYSDITAMHLAILAKSGLVTFHGSNASSAFVPANINVLGRMLVNGDGIRRTPGDDIPFSDLPPTHADGSEILFSRADNHGKNVKTVVPGRAQGQLLGGNMTCLLRLLGTPYAPDFRGAILFLEDTGEKAYRVDGMFTHLRLAGVLSQLSGLVIGQFDHSDETEQAHVATRLQTEAERIGVPCVSGAPIGHFPEQIIVPQGVQAELNADAGQLSIRAC
jgi:muramoyltetrapeptide carboxypeptidase